MKILKLISKNIKCIKAIVIEPKDNVVEITGRNAQGKSSALDSIIYALKGKAAMPDKPIREGEEYAEIILDLDDYLVIREIKKTDLGFKHALKISPKSVENAYINHMPPQGVLDKILGSLSFDPSEFIRMKPREQYDVLCELLGIHLDKYQLEKDKLEEERKYIGRNVKALKVHFAETPTPDTNLPDTITNLDKFDEELAEARKVTLKRKDIEHELNMLNVKSTNNKQNIEQHRVEILRLQSITSGLEQSNKIINQEIISLREELLKNPEIDTTQISYQKRETEVLNSKIRNRDTYTKLENELGDAVVEYDKYTSLLEDLQKRKEKEVHDIPFPIKGLGILDDAISYNGIPFSETSQAEKLRISLAIAEALNPELRVVLIKEGSFFDDAMMKEIKTWAKEKDVQVWIESVQNEADGNSFYIEDGVLK